MKLERILCLRSLWSLLSLRPSLLSSNIIPLFLLSSGLLILLAKSSFSTFSASLHSPLLTLRFNFLLGFLILSTCSIASLAFLSSTSNSSGFFDLTLRSKFLDFWVNLLGSSLKLLTSLITASIVSSLSGSSSSSSPRIIIVLLSSFLFSSISTLLGRVEVPTNLVLLFPLNNFFTLLSGSFFSFIISGTKYSTFPLSLMI
mmetsp:Transcript_39811/g.41465  ORF Transcript_39811/g.41465 Transcript_39811/m.41465 type:complete len:201 (-) Transcript_39811:278-880(-)